MRKIFLLSVASIMATALSAEVIKMDLSTATNLSDQEVAFETQSIPVYQGNLKDVMDSTFSTEATYSSLWVNEGAFSLSHLPSGNSYGGTSWEGFTISKVSSDTTNQFGCMAKGGVAGEGTPFVVGYYSDYIKKSLGYSPCQVIFEQEMYPTDVMICQSSIAMTALRHGLGVARPFTSKDTLALSIYAIDAKEYTNVGEPVIFYLAIDSLFNSTWTKVDLTKLGKTSGLNFELTSTDVGMYGANTPFYFNMDQLTVSTDQPQAIDKVETTSTKASKIVRNGQIYIVRDHVLYTIHGTRVK